MFCPNCGAEYIERITRCRDCEMDLVDQLPAPTAPEPEPPGPPLVEVLTTFGGTRATLIKSLLEGSGIQCVLSGTVEGTTYRLNVGDMAKVRILVKPEDESTARELIEAAAEGELELEN